MINVSSQHSDAGEVEHAVPRSRIKHSTTEPTVVPGQFLPSTQFIFTNSVTVYSFVCLFDLILYVPSTIFQLCRDGSSWVEPVLS